MKKMNKLTVAAVALVALGFASTAASAQVASSAGDLILGFQLNGSPTNLEVDLGSNSLFTTTATLNLSSDLKVSDLTSTYGSNWANTTAGTGVSWGAAATATLAGSKTQFDLEVTSTTLPSGQGTNTLHGYFSDINNLETQSGGISGATAAGTSTSALIGNSGNPASGIAASWTSVFGQVQTLGNVQTTGASSDELYQFVGNGTGGSVVDLGTLSLSSTGALTFTGSAAAVPEPSAYALGICAVLLFVVLRRRATVA